MYTAPVGAARQAEEGGGRRQQQAQAQRRDDKAPGARAALDARVRDQAARQIPAGARA